MTTKYQIPQGYTAFDTGNSLTRGIMAWLPASPLLLFGQRMLVAAGETAFNSSPVGTVGLGRKWSRSTNAGVDFGVNQILQQNSGVTVLVVAAPTSAAAMKVPFSQRIGSGNYTQTDFVFNAATIDSLGASAGNLALTTYHAGSAGVLAAGQVDGKLHCWVAGNGSANGYIFRDGVKQSLSTSTRVSTFTSTTQKLRIGNMADDAGTAYPCDDPVYLILVWDRLLSESDAAAVSANPALVFRSVANPGLWAAVTGAVSYMLSCLAGAYTVAGVQCKLLLERKLRGAAGAYTYAGVSAQLRKSRYVKALAASYTISAAAARLLKNKRLSVQSGSYTISGVQAELTHSGSSASYTLSCQPGHYTVTGAQAVLRRGRKLSALPGGYSLTGRPVSIVKGGAAGGKPAGLYLDAISGEVLYLTPLS